MIARLVVITLPATHAEFSVGVLFGERSLQAYYTRVKMTRRLDYSKWDHIEVSDDEDDTHPNIDTPSLFRWRHQARVERMEEQTKERAMLNKETLEHRQKVAEVTRKLQEIETTQSKETQRRLKAELAELKRQEEEYKKKEEALAKKERLTPWNVDTLSHDGFEKTVINVKKPSSKEMSEEEKQKQMLSFMDKYEKEIKEFGMLKDYGASSDYLRDHPHLVSADTSNYLTMWCVNLEVQDKHALMERVAHQTIVMQYILELAKQLDRDPRSCVPGFFARMKSAEKQYLDAFEDELSGFKGRVQQRAKVRIEEATRAYEEEERQKRLGPGGLDPVEVMETLPQELKECFETKSIPKLQEVLSKMSKEDAAYHMKRCVDSGLWVADAKAAGLTPANEEFQKLKEDGKDPDVDVENGDESSEEFYEVVDDGDGQPASGKDDNDLGLD